MIEWRPEVPRYVQVADVITGRITSGEYGDRHLVSENVLMQEFGIARATARKAIATLRDRGLVFTVRNLGTFVGQLDGESGVS